MADPARGIASGADIVLLPEIPYDIQKVGKALDKRRRQGKTFSILAVAEGALSKEEAKLGKKALAAKRAAEGDPSIALPDRQGAGALCRHGDAGMRTGAFPEGRQPCAYDRVLATRWARRRRG